MSNKLIVKLTDVADEMAFVDDDITVFLNKDDGEFEILNKMSDNYKKEAEQISLGNYVKLPDQFDIHEYKMMESFINTISDPRKSNKLYHAISGRGVFLRFKDTASDLELLDDWYGYRDQAYLEVAREWCEDNGIAYIDTRE